MSGAAHNVAVEVDPLGSGAMVRRFLGVTAAFAAALLTASITFTTPIASADADVQPVGTVPIPDGPAPSWIVADLDTGPIGSPQPEPHHAPASTIKTLLAQVVPRRGASGHHVVATDADTKVECNCAGVAPGQTYTAPPTRRRHFPGLGQRRRQHPGPHDRRPRSGRGQDERQGGRARDEQHQRVATPSGLDGNGIVRSGSHHEKIFRGAMANPVFAADHRDALDLSPSPARPAIGSSWSTRTRGCCIATPVCHRRQDGLHRHRPQDIRRRRTARRPPTGSHDDVRAGRGRVALPTGIRISATFWRGVSPRIGPPASGRL